VKPPVFEYHRPGSLQDALALLGAHPDAKPLAGGQSLIPAMNFRLASPARLIDLNALDELAGIAETADGGLRIGAMTRHSTVELSPMVAERAPLLAATMPFVAHRQIRNRGTIGGSLAHADPAAELPAVMVALGARLALASTRGTRSVPAEEFFTGLFATALEEGELVTAIEIPALPPRTGTAFLELARRHGDYALVGAAALVDGDSVKVGYLSVADVPTVVDLTGVPDDRLGEVALEQLEPGDDIHATADYRAQLVRVLTRRVLAAAADHARGRAA